MEQPPFLSKRQYSISDLERLRETLPHVNCVISKINPHSDVAGLFRLPYEAFRNPNAFTCLTKSLPTISNKPVIPQTARRQAGQSSEESDHYNKPEPYPNQSGHQVRWSLRRRDDADRSSQPYSAPTGDVAQQSENFQRFYRAVVSPTHVRVTAGGRIVPNTRVNIPPAFEWDAEKQLFQPVQSGSQAKGAPQQTYWHQSPVTALPSIGPYHLRMPGPAFMLPMIPQQLSTVQQSGVSQKSLVNSEYSTDGKVSDNVASVKISPPAQFDQHRPFVFNGQLVYPLPQGFHPPVGSLPIPLNVVGTSNIPGPSMAPAGYLPPQMAPQGTSMLPTWILPGQPVPLPIQHIPQPYNPAIQPYKATSELVSVVELTRHQIHELRQLLKTIDNQLANNKHQINETLLSGQRVAVETQIKTMEGMLQLQLQAELKQQSVIVNGDRTALAPAGNRLTPNPAAVLSQPVQTVQTSATEIARGSVEEKARPNDLEFTQQVAAPRDPNYRLVSHSASRLPAAAAMAPPFQPRSQVTAKPVKATHEYEATPVVSSAFQETDLGSGVAAGHGKYTTSGPIGLPRSQTDQEISTSAVATLQSLGLQRSQTFHGQTAALAAMAVQPQAIPYLVGTLPAGLKASDATPQDLTYSRPLTEDEVRARYLYWGKAPRHVQIGLPKFDGKDFYPPSPVKENALLTTPNRTYSSRAVLPDFSNLFTEPGYPGWKADSPIQTVGSIPHLFPATSNESGNGAVHPSSPHVQASIDVPDICQSMTTNLQKRTAGKLDFSDLFLDPGLQEASSPSPPPPGPFFLDSYTGPKKNANSPGGHDAASDISTVDIHLSPPLEHDTTGKSKMDASLSDRIASVNSEQQTLFLQNLLRNNAVMSGPVSLGSVTTTTAQGHLPQYRGYAAASLSPALTNTGTLDYNPETKLKTEQPRVANGSMTNVKAHDLLSENRPFSRAIPIVRPPTDSLDAQSYMRYLVERADDEKPMNEPDWKAGGAGTGPVTGSDW